MGTVYKNKRSSGCALCKPHKHGWAPKKKTKIKAKEHQMDIEIAMTTAGTDKSGSK